MGKTCLIMELIYNIAKNHGEYSVFTGVEKREGIDLSEMTDSGDIDKNLLVFEPMNESPGVRMRVGSSGITMEEYFSQVPGHVVMLFIDNIFRFVQTGSEDSAPDLLKRIPSALGWSSGLQERITSTQTDNITSVQAIYVPWGDFSESDVAIAFPHLDATTVMSRALCEIGIHPAIDPLKSSSRILNASVLGEEHYRTALDVQNILQRFEDLKYIIQDSGMNELSETDRLIVERARKVQRFLSQPFFVTERFTNIPGCYVPVAGTVRGFREIVDGKHDEIPEDLFLNVGTIDDVTEAFRKAREQEKMC